MTAERTPLQEANGLVLLALARLDVVKDRHAQEFGLPKPSPFDSDGLPWIGTVYECWEKIQEIEVQVNSYNAVIYSNTEVGHRQMFTRMQASIKRMGCYGREFNLVVEAKKRAAERSKD
jgi:hypothetical protein